MKSPKAQAEEETRRGLGREAWEAERAGGEGEATRAQSRRKETEGHGIREEEAPCRWRRRAEERLGWGWPDAARRAPVSLNGGVCRASFPPLSGLRRARPGG